MAHVGGARGPPGDHRHQVTGAASLLPVAELHVGEGAPDLKLLDAQETEVALSSLWERGPLALIFLRHFG
jgi:hypothetical protein